MEGMFSFIFCPPGEGTPGKDRPFPEKPALGSRGRDYASHRAPLLDRPCPKGCFQEVNRDSDPLPAGSDLGVYAPGSLPPPPRDDPRLLLRPGALSGEACLRSSQEHP